MYVGIYHSEALLAVRTERSPFVVGVVCLCMLRVFMCMRVFIRKCVHVSFVCACACVREVHWVPKLFRGARISL